MSRYRVHFSQAHDLYYVIETQSDRGRIIYAHPWRMCAEYVAERHQSQLSHEDGDECPEIQDLLSMTQPNALFPSPAGDASSRRTFGGARLAIRDRTPRGRNRTEPESVQNHFARSVLRSVRCSLRLVARRLRHAIRSQKLGPHHDLSALIPTDVS
jgi:hypothetical protein